MCKNTFNSYLVNTTSKSSNTTGIVSVNSYPNIFPSSIKKCLCPLFHDSNVSSSPSRLQISKVISLKGKMVTAVVLITQRGFPSQSVTMLWSHIGHQIKISVPEFVKFLEICHTIHEGYFENKSKGEKQ